MSHSSTQLDRMMDDCSAPAANLLARIDFSHTPSTTYLPKLSWRWLYLDLGGIDAAGSTRRSHWGKGVITVLDVQFCTYVLTRHWLCWSVGGWPSFHGRMLRFPVPSRQRKSFLQYRSRGTNSFQLLMSDGNGSCLGAIFSPHLTNSKIAISVATEEPSLHLFERGSLPPRLQPMAAGICRPWPFAFAPIPFSVIESLSAVYIQKAPHHQLEMCWHRIRDGGSPSPLCDMFSSLLGALRRSWAPFRADHGVFCASGSNVCTCTCTVHQFGGYRHVGH